GEWHTDHLPVYFYLDTCIRHLAEQPRITPTPFARHLQFHVHPLADEALEMRPGAQHSIGPGRRHLEPVSGGNGIFHIEHRRDFPADPAPVLHPNPLRPVDEDAHHPLRAAGRELELDQLIAQLSRKRLYEGYQPFTQVPGHRRKLPSAQTKMGPRGP